jgi:hypothetical protein
MADYVTKIRTSSGDKQIDYTALANLPQFDERPIDESTNLMDSNAIYHTFVEYDKKVTDEYLKDVYQTIDEHVITIDKIDGVIQIEQGGTGAVNAVDALENLGGAKKYHRHGTEDIDVSQKLADAFGLTDSSSIEDILQLISVDIDSIYDILGGTSDKYRWNMLKWGTYEKLISYSVMTAAWGTASSGREYDTSTVFKMEYSNSFIQEEDGTLSLVDPITETRYLPPEVGMYFRFKLVTDGVEKGEWSTLRQRTEYTTSKSTTYQAAGGIDDDGKPIPTDNFYTNSVFNDVIEIIPSYKYIGSVYDDDANAYPNNEWVDGTLYILESSPSIVPCVVTGEYTGTGGSIKAANPIEITFSRRPMLVLIISQVGTNIRQFVYGSKFSFGIASGAGGYASEDNADGVILDRWAENVLSFYGNSAAGLNEENIVYKYMALCY